MQSLLAVYLVQNSWHQHWLRTLTTQSCCLYYATHATFKHFSNQPVLPLRQPSDDSTFTKGARTTLHKTLAFCKEQANDKQKSDGDHKTIFQFCCISTKSHSMVRTSQHHPKLKSLCLAPAHQGLCKNEEKQEYSHA
jgi:hypothetical protein